jgi:hypothetical protein
MKPRYYFVFGVWQRPAAGILQSRKQYPDLELPETLEFYGVIDLDAPRAQLRDDIGESILYSVTFEEKILLRFTKGYRHDTTYEISYDLKFNPETEWYEGLWQIYKGKNFKDKGDAGFVRMYLFQGDPKLFRFPEPVIGPSG